MFWSKLGFSIEDIEILNLNGADKNG